MPLLVILLLFFFIALVMIFGTVFLVRQVSRKLTHTLGVVSLPRSVTKSLNESRRYARLIVQTARHYPPGPLRNRLDLTLRPVDAWLDNLTRLEKALGKLYQQRNLPRELRQANFEIDNLRRKLLMATDREASLLRDLIKSKQQHLAALKELELFQTQAELKIHKIASDLGATHAEMLLLVARGDFNENRFRRLDENLQENLHSMQDMLGAMEELGYYSAAG
jgi:hypothetical protein